MARAIGKKLDFVREAIRAWLFVGVLVLLLLGLLGVVSSQIWFEGPLASVILQLGSTLVAAALVSLFYEYSVRKLYVGILSQEVRNTAKEVQPLLKSLADSGILVVHQNRSAIPWIQLLDSAKISVRILGTSLRFWEALAIQNIESAINRGCDVKLLSLDPKGTCAKERGRELPEFPNPTDFVEDVRVSRESLMRVGCEVRKYNELPGFVFAIIDRQMFVCFLTNIERGRMSVHFEITHSSALARKLAMKFNKLWREDLSWPELKM